jgi:hypothetical protein
VTNEYYANRDEYDSVGQSQPYKFEEYVRQNIDLLKEKYRRDKYRIVGDSDER